MSQPNILTASNMKLLRSFYSLPPALCRTLTSRPISHSSSQFLSQMRIQKRNSSTHPTPSPSNLPDPDQAQASQHDTLIPPPKPNSGPLLTRLPNRALPSYNPGLFTPTTRLWLKTLPIFLLLITLSSLSIFNYQKSSSSTVNSILYACRTSPTVRDLLGDEIYFASRIPWISGELNQLHGNIDISFWIKGTRGQGMVRFVSVRRRRDGFFETLEWSLTTSDGRVVQLLEIEGARDPMGMAQGGDRLDGVVEL